MASKQPTDNDSVRESYYPITRDAEAPKFYLQFTLTRHIKAINALAISPQGSVLLSGGSDSRVVVWNLGTGEMIQEICVPSAGYISCLTWIKLSEGEGNAFAFGASDGNIHIYERVQNQPLFTFLSIAVAHEGAIESLAWDPIHSRLASVGNSELGLWKVSPEAKSLLSLAIDFEKQPYVARSVHFCDDGSSVIVSYLESGFVFCFSIDPWQLKWKKKANSRIGCSYSDGRQILISNLRDGVDRYMLPTMHCVQTFHHTILMNVPFQTSVAKEAGLVIVGGDDGFARVFDFQTGAFKMKLDHGSAGDLVVAVTAHEGVNGCTIVTGSALDGHSNVKVWRQRQQQITSPPPTTSDTRTSGLKQGILFAMICILVNLVMRYLPSSLPDIPVFVQDFGQPVSRGRHDLHSAKLHHEVPLFSAMTGDPGQSVSGDHGDLRDAIPSSLPERSLPESISVDDIKAFSVRRDLFPSYDEVISGS